MSICRSMSTMRSIKSKATLAKEISADTKQTVLERQGFRSISGVALGSTAEFHHVIFRSGSGVGYEWNIVALTPEEHRLFHDKRDIPVNGRCRYSWIEFDILMKNHLKLWYDGWSEEKCKYHKYCEEEDYEVIRRDRKI